MTVMLVAGAAIQYATGLPFGADFDFKLPNWTSAAPAANQPPSYTHADVPVVSNARGAEDAQRADTPMGSTVDLQRCYATMIARRLGATEAKTVCAKLIGGITH